MSVKRNSQSEDGAIAVFYALMAVMLLTVAALGTDIGNAVSRRTSTQGQADFAAYNAAQLLTSSARAGTTPPAAIVDEVRDALNENQPQKDGDACWRSTPATCVTSAMLTDADLNNGDVRYTALGLRVTAPKNRVNFGFANVFGASGVSVAGQATVNVFSPGTGVLPMFAVDGCDYGRQTLTDPANGQGGGGTPNLAAPNDNGSVDLASVALYDDADALAQTIPKDAADYSAIIQSANWDGTTSIGFFRPDGSNPITTTALLSSADDSPLVLPLTNATSVVKVVIPTTVTAIEGVWYLRALSGTNNQKWSPADEALPIRIGETVLECSAGSNGGNFGTLRIPREDVSPSNDIAMNVADGLDDPLNLVVHAAGRTKWLNNVVWDGSCVHGTEGAVVSTGTGATPLRPDTNCVDTDPGLPANEATRGFVTGVSEGNNLIAPGLLVGPTLCDSAGGTAQRNVTIQGTPYGLNNDVLSCFLTPGASLADLMDENYAGPALLTADILKSPRFAYVPILAKEPATGSSTNYSIIDFRAAFITDEVPSSSAIKGSVSGTADNGIIIAQNDVKQVKVVFFNSATLPRDGEIPVTDYLGIGQRIVHLVD